MTIFEKLFQRLPAAEVAAVKAIPDQEWSTHLADVAAKGTTAEEVLSAAEAAVQAAEAKACADYAAAWSVELARRVS